MILQRLKTETSDVHHRLEQKLDLLNPDFSSVRYDSLLQRFYGFYAPFEPKIEQRVEWGKLHFDIAARRKLPLLEADLQQRGFTLDEIHNLSLCTELPATQSLPSALGSLYVLEGSTLGGQILTRHFIQVLGIAEKNGISFFHSYGENVGAMWRECGTMLHAQATSREIEDEIIGAARATFQSLENWLCE